MSLLQIPQSITALSELEIDVDKDWQGFGITNLKELASGMKKGDVIVHDGSRLVKLSPDSSGNELTSEGPGHSATWKAPPSS